MNNVLLDHLPTTYNGYLVNTWYQVGIQVFLVYDDKELAGWEKSNVIIDLMFSDDNGELRDYPKGKELDDCIQWFLNGWYHDKAVESSSQKILDFDIDQYRIYADFLQIYGIDLSESDMHFWKFMGLLWNMPYKYSSFLQAIDIRTKTITKNMGAEEKKAIRKAQKVYELEQDKDYTEQEKDKIDDYDRMMAKLKGR